MSTATLSRQSQRGRIAPRQESAGNVGAANVGDLERLASLVGGSLLMFHGTRRGTIPGLAMALAGVSLVSRGWTGHCGLYESLGVNTVRRRAPQTSVPAGAGIRVEERFIINRSPEELFDF